MKRAGLILGLVVIANIAWMGLVRSPLPPIPEIRSALSKEVPFSFSINSMTYTGLEFSLNEKIGGKGMYVQFGMANAWKSGRAGLVLQGIKAQGGMKGGMSRDKYLNDQKRKEESGKDFSDFMKDGRGRSLSTYSFNQTLVEGKSGKPYMLVAYDGPAMEMIQTLEVPRPVTLPAHISRQFIDKGIIQFQPGTMTLDSKVQGFLYSSCG